MNQTAIFQYYATDWVAMLLTLIAFYLLGEQKKSGFIFALLSNLAWIAFAIIADSLAIAILNLILIGLNLKGFLKWK